MQPWQARIDRRHGALYLAIADAIGAAVAQGELRGGDQLPPHRVLAASLGIDLTTASRGYAEARRRGLLSAGVGRGTFVRAEPSGAEQGEERALVDLSMNLPPQPREPALRQMVQDGMAQLLRRSDMGALMAYRIGAGTAADRAAAVDWLQGVLGDIDPARLLVCAGGQAALTAILAVLARPGDVVLTEALTYPGFRALAGQLGLRLVAVAGDADGPLPDALDRLCREVGPKAFHCIPTMHNPTAVTMPLARRAALAEVARRHTVPVIEDDAYGVLASAPLAAITGAEGVGYHVATLSKCLSPGLRIAYAAAPDAAAAGRLAAALRATSLMPAPLMAGLVTGWMRDGSAAAYRDAVRAEAAARQHLARDILPADGFAAHPEGLHVWLTLPAGWDRMDFWAHARRLGLALVPSDTFLVADVGPNAVRISLGAAESAAALETVLRVLARAISSETTSGPGSVV